MSRTQYQYSLENPSVDELNTWAPRLVERLRALPELRDVASDQQDQGLETSIRIDRNTASRLGITPQMIDDALYNAFGQRQISTIFTQLNQYRVVLEVKPEFRQDPDALKQIYLRVGRRAAGAALDVHHHRGAGHPAPGEPPGPVPGGHRLLQPGARGVARRGGGRHRAGPARPQDAGEHRDALPGRRARLPGLARQRAAADPGRGVHRLHRAGRALRELDPPGDDPVHPALRGGGRPARPDGDARST